jgi:hypothetical protein
MLDGLSTGELLTLATFLVRDISAVWTLATAGVSLWSVSAGRPERRTITGGALVWLVAYGGYLAPVDKSRFFNRGSIHAMLIIALALWAIAFARLILSTVERRLS